MCLYLAWLWKHIYIYMLIYFEITMPAFSFKCKFVFPVVLWPEKSIVKTNALFAQIRGESVSTDSQRGGGFLFHFGFWFLFFSELLLGWRTSIWSWQFYLSPEIKAMRHVLLAFWIATLFVYRTCWSEIYCIGMAFVSSLKDIPSLPHVLISILSFTLILWWKVHASSSTCEWCFFLFFFFSFLVLISWLLSLSFPFIVSPFFLMQRWR